MYIGWIKFFILLYLCLPEVGDLSPKHVGQFRHMDDKRFHINCMATHSGAVGLGHCVTSRKVAGSIPDGVIGIFHWHNPSGCTMALGVDSASKRNEYQQYLLQGKCSRSVRLTTLPPSFADCLEVQEASISYSTQGVSRPVQLLLYLYMYCSIICGNKMPTRCNRGFYCRSYCLLNMFRASLCP